MPHTDYKQLFETFRNLNILIIGDVMVDSYIWGKVERISPEAPVPVVQVKKRENRLGGAANVALNVQSLGATPLLCACVGNDPKGDEFINMLMKLQMDASGIVICNERVTTTKFRVIGNNSQLLRVDEEVTEDLCGNDEKNLIRIIHHLLENNNINNSGRGIDAIIFEDYNKGVITSGIIASTVQTARKKNIPVIVDPKKKNFDAYKHVSLFKPNLKELKEGLKTDINPGNINALKQAVLKLKAKLQTEMILVTLSEAGMLLCLDENGHTVFYHTPAHIRSIADVSGAGDTVVSTAALCLAAKQPPETMTFLSNLAGGIVCEDVGVVPVNKEKLLREANRLSKD